jgi:hypothetical protein
VISKAFSELPSWQVRNDSDIFSIGTGNIGADATPYVYPTTFLLLSEHVINNMVAMVTVKLSVRASLATMAMEPTVLAVVEQPTLDPPA